VLGSTPLTGVACTEGLPPAVSCPVPVSKPQDRQTQPPPPLPLPVQTRLPPPAPLPAKAHREAEPGSSRRDALPPPPLQSKGHRGSRGQRYKHSALEEGKINASLEEFSTRNPAALSKVEWVSVSHTDQSRPANALCLLSPLSNSKAFIWAFLSFFPSPRPIKRRDSAFVVEQQNPLLQSPSGKCRHGHPH